MVEKLFSVAPAFEDIEGEILADFNFNLNPKNISQQVEKIILIHFKDDFLVPFSHSKKLRNYYHKQNL